MGVAGAAGLSAADKGLLLGKGIPQGCPRVPAAGLTPQSQRRAEAEIPPGGRFPHRLSPGLQPRPSLSADTPRAGGCRPSSAVFLRLREAGSGGPANAGAVMQPHRHGAAPGTAGSVGRAGGGGGAATLSKGFPKHRKRGLQHVCGECGAVSAGRAWCCQEENRDARPREVICESGPAAQRVVELIKA